MKSHRNINFLVLKFLSPILIITGVVGYYFPNGSGMISNETFYNLFHIDVGLIGIIVLLTMNVTAVRSYNIFLGIVYLYQAAASHYSIFPDETFKYTITDDIIHLDIGLTLVLIGVIARRNIEGNEEVIEQRSSGL